MTNLAARVAKIEKMGANHEALPRIVVIRRYVTPGDPENPPANFIVSQGKVWARREGEDAEALIDRVKADWTGRILKMEARATAPE